MQIISTDRRSMPSAYHAGNSVDFKVVLVLGEASDVAAYRGIGTPEWIAQHGDKLSLKEAAPHFPTLEGDLVARGWTYREA